MRNPTGDCRAGHVPVAFSAFPGEIFRAPHSCVQNGYPTVMYCNKPDRGAHFAA